MRNKDIARYCREVQALLPGGFQQKRSIVKGLRESIIQSMDGAEKIDYDAITQRFGSPTQVATSYVEEMEPQEVLHGLRIRRKIVAAFVVGMAMIVLIWIIAVVISGIDFANSINGHIEVYINEY